MTSRSFRRACVMAIALPMAGLALPAQAAPLTPADYVEISQLYDSYADALDTDNATELLGTFAPGGMVQKGAGPTQTILDLAYQIGRDDHPQVPPAARMVSNILVTATATGANGTCYGILNLAPNDDGRFTGTPEFYSDTLVKTGDGWRFKTRHVFSASAEP